MYACKTTNLTKILPSKILPTPRYTADNSHIFPNRTHFMDPSASLNPPSSLPLSARIVIHSNQMLHAPAPASSFDNRLNSFYVMRPLLSIRDMPRGVSSIANFFEYLAHVNACSTISSIVDRASGVYCPLSSRVAVHATRKPMSFSRPYILHAEEYVSLHSV